MCNNESQFEKTGGLDHKKYKRDSYCLKWKMVVYFLQLFDPSSPKASNPDGMVCNCFMLVKNMVLENYKILTSLAILVNFWSMRYLWKHLCNGIQDFSLSHTFTYSFSHFHIQNQNIWKDFKVITISGCLTIYSVDTF